MRILLDECLNVALRHQITGHEVETVEHRRWKGKKNGDLLRLAEGDFDAIVTADKSIPSQQYLSQFDIALIVLRPKSLDIEDIQALIKRVPEITDQVAPGKVIYIRPE